MTRLSQTTSSVRLARAGSAGAGSDDGAAMSFPHGEARPLGAGRMRPDGGQPGPPDDRTLSLVAAMEAHGLTQAEQRQLYEEGVVDVHIFASLPALKIILHSNELSTLQRGVSATRPSKKFK